MVNTYLQIVLPYDGFGLLLFCSVLIAPLFQTCRKSRQQEFAQARCASDGRILVALGSSRQGAQH
jgi:hypothetical protein